jgi:hypothetical protein
MPSIKCQNCSEQYEIKVVADIIRAKVKDKDLIVCPRCEKELNTIKCRHCGEAIRFVPLPEGDEYVHIKTGQNQAMRPLTTVEIRRNEKNYPNQKPPDEVHDHFAEPGKETREVEPLDQTTPRFGPDGGLKRSELNQNRR